MRKIGERRQRLPLRFPFGKAVENLRSTCLNRSDYDPVSGARRRVAPRRRYSRLT